MADLSINICGIKSPNPFWLASAPPTNTGEQIMRGFDAGWGGAVWKTLGEPIVNVDSRFGAIDYSGTKVISSCIYRSLDYLPPFLFSFHH